MDDQTRIEIEAAAFRRLQKHLMEDRTDAAEHRHDEFGGVLPELPGALVSRGRQRTRHST